MINIECLTIISQTIPLPSRETGSGQQFFLNVTHTSPQTVARLRIHILQLTQYPFHRTAA